MESITGRFATVTNVSNTVSQINTIYKDLKDGKALTAGTYNVDGKRVLDPTTGIIGNHRYVISSYTSDGTVAGTKLTLYNPWGHDTESTSYRGDANSNDGYVTVTWSEFVKYFRNITTLKA